MKKCILISLGLIFNLTLIAQENLNELLAAGINDAKRFSTDYLLPATDGLAYGVSTGWFNNAKAPKKHGVELSIIGNATFIKDESKSFVLNVSDYENIRFPDNSPSKTVATALGHNDPDITVIVTYEDPIFGNQEVELTLPTGIGAANVNLIPTAFLQGSFSILEGTQLKARFFPKVDTNDAKIGLYGVGLQQEFTAWLPEDSKFPLSISGLVAYTHLDANYDFTDTQVVDGENQQVQTKLNSLLFQVIAGTNFKNFNLYGSLGYLSANTTTDLLGTYRVSNGVLFSEEIVDPFSIESETKGVTATFGGNLKLGFFGINASYTFAEFDAASIGINFMF
ncbi:DUF6588 family protein [Olleya aquimaris]|uniref:DUF3308 domain-containing protein n=1 Tax=Olleya aquimaris TaxID=639310 RepID=A0A327R596_9FLAO|nr:DUF6588 family protein [Olleya aquimaris]RAJ11791.1 hypothetical protein LY08_02676 [Olleya aquimaris]